MSSSNLAKLEEACVESGSCESSGMLQIAQKALAELIGTYLLVFAGCCSVVLEKQHGNITFPGICLVWGFTVMFLIYTIGHISGAHFNPAVTVTLTILRKFPSNEVPLYIAAHVLGSILASLSLYLLFGTTEKEFFGTVPSGSNIQSLIFEIITTFLLLFVACGLSDKNAFGQLGGISVGLVVIVDVFIAGPVSGASMNPARTIGPAIVMGIYKGIWVYIVGPFVGALLGALTYNLIKTPEKDKLKK
ncbi:putative aquaporin NIP-type [Senna tora]|uniref:Putative aquaporin NIP-type n=1 Tax=Senna tora TaxID=362788 RepID=A0A834W424_9FABA|nr:putative aquaporin NIP-type [Senna tora]